MVIVVQLFSRALLVLIVHVPRRPSKNCSGLRVEIDAGGRAEKFLAFFNIQPFCSFEVLIVNSIFSPADLETLHR